jgi:hypothetical protein
METLTIYSDDQTSFVIEENRPESFNLETTKTDRQVQQFD